MLPKLRALSLVLAAAVLLATEGLAVAQEGDYCRQINRAYARLADDGGGQRAAMATARRYDCFRPFVFRRPHPACYDALRTLRGGERWGGGNESRRRALLAEMREAGCAPGRSDGGSGLETLCVRLCDGFFFPISRNADRGDLRRHGDACQAQCPGTRAELYTRRAFSEGLDQARSLSGARYSELPNAFSFQQRVTPDCSCQPAGGWSRVADAYRPLYPERLGAVFPDETAGQSLAWAPLPRPNPRREALIAAATALDPAERVIESPPGEMRIVGAPTPLAD